VIQIGLPLLGYKLNEGTIVYAACLRQKVLVRLSVFEHVLEVVVEFVALIKMLTVNVQREK